MRISDWSSDVCSSDLLHDRAFAKGTLDLAERRFQGLVFVCHIFLNEAQRGLQHGMVSWLFHSPLGAAMKASVPVLFQNTSSFFVPQRPDRKSTRLNSSH